MGYTLSWTPLRFSDFTYQPILRLLPKVISPDCNVTVDADGFRIGNDEDNCVYFPKDAPCFCWEKTNRLPYGREVMKALILMVEYGVTSGLDHDDSDMTWYLEALDAVNAVWPLASYDSQKRYFVELGKEKGYTGITVPHSGNRSRGTGIPFPNDEGYVAHGESA